MIDELDRVVLTTDTPEHGLAAGDVGNIRNGAYADAVTGNRINVSNGSMSFRVRGNSAGIYVLNGSGRIWRGWGVSEIEGIPMSRLQKCWGWLGSSKNQKTLAFVGCCRSPPMDRAALRKRVGVEHGLAHVSQRQGNEARYGGVRETTYHLRLVCAIQSLERAQRLSQRAVANDTEPEDHGLGIGQVDVGRGRVATGVRSMRVFVDRRADHAAPILFSMR